MYNLKIGIIESIDDVLKKYNLKLYPESLKNIIKALEINPNNKRLKDNYDIINKKINPSS